MNDDHPHVAPRGPINKTVTEVTSESPVFAIPESRRVDPGGNHRLATKALTHRRDKPGGSLKK